MPYVWLLETSPGLHVSTVYTKKWMKRQQTTYNKKSRDLKILKIVDMNSQDESKHITLYVI